MPALADPRLVAFNPALIGQGIGQGLQLADQYATMRENRAMAPIRQSTAQNQADLTKIQLEEAERRAGETPLGVAIREVPRGDFPMPAEVPPGTVGNPNVPAGTPVDIVEVERVQLKDGSIVERPRRIVQSAEELPQILTMTPDQLAGLAPGSRYQIVGQNPDGTVQVSNLQGQVLGGTTARLQQGGAVRLPDGTVVKTYFDPNNQGYFYQDASGNAVPVPANAQPTTVSAESRALLSVKDFNNLENAIKQEEGSLRALESYYNTSEGTRQGIGGLVDKLSASLLTLLGNENLSDEQLGTFVREGQLQGLIGRVRTDILGPGVLTNQDAARIMEFLGGDSLLLRNKERVRQAIGAVMAEKYDRYNILVNQYNRQAGRGIYSEYQPINPIEIDPSKFGGKSTDMFVRPNESRRVNAAPMTGGVRATDENAQQNAQRGTSSQADAIYQELLNKYRR